MAQIKDLTGMKFGRLKVIRLIGRKYGGGLWLCLCHCGVEIQSTSHELRSNRRKSCGCLNIGKKPIDLFGQKFGRLTVIRFSGFRDSDRRILWECVCECGKSKTVSSQALKSCRTQSCGCLRIGHKGRTAKASGVAMSNKTYYSYKSKAKTRRLSFTLNFDDAISLFLSPCYYCNSKPSNTAKSKAHNGAFIYSGIDRLDSFSGYTKENCVPCCWHCNRAKGLLTTSEFIEWVRKVYLYAIKEMGIG